jgi:hypothetical protein
MFIAQDFLFTANTIRSKTERIFTPRGCNQMSYIPEPWKRELSDDVEIAEDMSAMEALDPPYEPEGRDRSSLFRRYWERLLGSNNR